MTTRLLMIALAALMLAVAPMCAMAQITLPTKCGAFGVGQRADGSTWAGVAPRMWVDRTGVWRVCQPWVPDGGDPEQPEVRAVPCLGRDTWEEWADGDAMCSSMPPGAYTGTTSRLTFTEDGRVRLIRDEWGPVQGMAIFRCVRGTWRLEGSFCRRGQ